jgi:membrane-associated phospholipid phosphatase
MLFSFATLQAQSDQTRKTTQDIGDILHTALPLAAGLTTVIIKDKVGTWQFAKAFGANLALTYGLKHTLNKSRPDGNTDGLAFPSGHTSVAFQSASFIQKRYGWSYGVPAYALASLVAYSRVEGIDRRHDGWDVVGGIIVGIGSTYLFTTPYQKEHLELAFSSNENNYLIGLKFKF